MEIRFRLKTLQLPGVIVPTNEELQVGSYIRATPPLAFQVNNFLRMRRVCIQLTATHILQVVVRSINYNLDKK